jgi:hypothetical protein
MRKNVVYHKTAKGLEAIATRQSGLSPKQRSMLIMVDGKRGYEELERIAQGGGDAELHLDQLLEAGLIEPSAPAPEPPLTAQSASPAAEGTASPSATKPLTLAEAQRFFVRRLTDIMGPNAEDFCLRIEAARNLHDLQAAVSRAEGMVRQLRGSNAAAEFHAEVQARMPAG